ncbi:hypothetical protein N0V90_013092 [Kalmusia sp. IMI 367209]|nr:hypothetical protein N0V90_013092 [Kalmusia sp. IMI 367209]
MDTTSTIPPPLPNRTTSHLLTHPKTQQAYLIQISRPLSLQKSIDLRKARLPIIYILDGNAFFLTASDIAWRREVAPSWTGGGIIISIGYPHDATETGSLYNFAGRNKDYTPFSPSIWWGNRFILGEEEMFYQDCEVEKGDKMKGTPRLELSFGSLEEKMKKTSGESDEDFKKRAEVAGEKRMGPNARELYERLQANGKLRDVRFTEFEGEDHGTVSTVGLLRALTIFFAE